MKIFEKNTQAFILRLWVEHREIEGAHHYWRGMIEHVETGKRHYFDELQEIPNLIIPYLVVPGVDIVERKSVWLWLKQAILQKIKKKRE